MYALDSDHWGKKRVKLMDPQGYVLQTILKQSFFGYFEGD